MAWPLRLLARLRPLEGWLIFTLAWLAIVCLPALLIDAQWLTGMVPGIWLVTLALPLAWRLAHTRLHGALLAGLLLLLGVLADLTWGVHVLHIPAAVDELWRHLAWLLDGMRSPAPPWRALPAQWAAWLDFAQRVGWWVGGLAGGAGFPDNLVISGLALLLVWGAAAWAGFWMARHGRPLEGLAPAIGLMALQAFVAGRGQGWLLALLTLLPLLLALGRTRWLTRRWDRAGLDYSGEIGLTAGIAGAWVAIVVLIATPALPFLTSRQVADFFWRRFEKPYRQVEQRLNQSFPAARGAHSLVPPGGVVAGGLPRAHLLGGRPELGQEVALRVAVRGARPADVLYWRGQTYASYDGRGWLIDPEATLSPPLAAGQPWSEDSLAGRHTVLSLVEIDHAARSILYAPNEPVSVDRPSRALMSGGSLVQVQAPDQPRAYTVLSAVPELNPNALRAAGAVYPPEIAGRYLQLPAELPPDVAAYARRVAGAAATPYDAAVAIEAALRQIPYSFDVPVPPAGRDLVSWFLFDLRRGYCDYYASAMVVMARSRGIPARLAVGYSQGTLEPATGKYLVTELQAHSWPELYFPRLGWVPFEPTGYEPEPRRQPAAVPDWLLGGNGPPPISDAALGELRRRDEQRAGAAAGRWLVATASGLLALWTAWQLTGRQLTAPSGGTAAAYARLAAWGERLGRPALASDTPREYAAALGEAAHSAALRARVAAPAAAAAAETVRRSAYRLAVEYEQSRYAVPSAARPPHPATPSVSAPRPADPDASSIPAAQGDLPNPARRWTPLFAALRRLWLAHTWRL